MQNNTAHKDILNYHVYIPRSRTAVYYLLSLSLSFLTLVGVGLNLTYRPELPHDPCNSVYFWKTSFEPTGTDLRFLENHDVKRIYMRMFDIVANNGGTPPEEAVVPNATLRFPTVNSADYWESHQMLSQAEFVPVVYITVDALRAMELEIDIWAEKIVERVSNMISYNFIPNVSEYQLDCDWTESTEQIFFSLCASVKKELIRRNKDYRLSSTIRLHQLSKPVPPVDFGVLMVYNTGNFTNPDAHNSILDIEDVKPYIKNLSGYRLPLDVAYPLYTWQLLFRNRQFTGLLRDTDLSDSENFIQIGENTHKALRDVVNGRTVIHKDDIVRTETSDYKSIRDVKKLIDQKISSPNYSVILYHLDTKTFATFTRNEIDSIYTCRR